MAERFNLTAQLQIQANANSVTQAVSQVKKQLSPLNNVKLNVQTNARALAQVNKQAQDINKGFRQANKSAGELNRTLLESARRFSVITIATGSLLSLANAFKRSVKEAIAFEAELVKISQVTGTTVPNLKGLADEVTRLSTTLGVSSAALLNTSRILLQTGLSADKARQALDILAKTTLAATFDDIQSTTEGAIAILNQFGAQASRTGTEIKFLENSLDAINAVSKNFAVESADLVSAIRRVGGVFANAGGSVEELVALFTSVRATTRESAETIATGLRTIFTRIQRQDTVDQLKGLGIALQDAQGNFVGAFEAVRRLSEGLKGLDPRSFRFSQIVEELGGFRQIGKVIPLINQFTIAQQALNVAQSASGSISKDAQTAQQALATEIAKTREQFDALIRGFTDSSAFRSIINGALSLAQSFIRVAEALEPLLPLITGLFALKAGQGFASAIGLLKGGVRGGGVQASRFASGGMVPGTGNRDTVPAMLTPGEFVIRKSSVSKIGANNLADMNARGYAGGGFVKRIASRNPETARYSAPATIKYNKGVGTVFNNSVNRFNSNDQLGFRRLQDLNIDVNRLYPVNTRNKSPIYRRYAETVMANNPRERGKAFEQVIKSKLGATLASGAGAGKPGSSRLDGIMNGTPIEIRSRNEAVNDGVLANKVFGGALNPRSNVDEIMKSKLSQSLLTNSIETNKPDKVSFGAVRLIADVTNLSDINKESKQGKLGGKDAVASSMKNIRRVRGYATGGSVSGSDTVPAMLTPGEFVFNKSAAQSIGYSNLNRMNKNGVTGYAEGGIVGVQKFANGGGVTSGSIKQEIKIGGLNQQIASVTQQMAREEASLKILQQQRQPEIAEQKKHTQEIKDLNSSIAKLDAQYDQIAAAGKSGAKGSKALFRILDIRAKKEQEIVAAEAKLNKVTTALEKSGNVMIATERQLADANKKRASLISQARDIKQTATASLTTGTQTNFREASQQASFKTQFAAALPAAQTGGLGTLGKNATTASQYLQSFGASTKTTQQSIQLYEKIIKQGGSATLALEKAMQLLTGKTAKQAQTSDRNIAEYMKSVNALATENSIRAKLGKAMQAAATAYQTAAASAKGGFSAVAGGAKTVATGVGQKAQRAAGAASSLQMFAFFGTALSDAAGSALGLADAQKKALTQTVALAGMFLFLGSTVLDLVGNLANLGSTASETAEAGANALSTETELAKAAANTQSTAGVLSFAGAMSIATKAALANAQANLASTASEQAEAGANAQVIASELAEVQANVAAVAAESAETSTNAAAATSEAIETAANNLSAATTGGITAGLIALTGPLLALTVAVGGVYLVMSYFSAQAKAVADEMSKASTDLIAKASSEGGVSQDRLVGAARASADARDASTAASARQSVAVKSAAAGGVAGLAGAVAFGAALGSTIPVIGTVVGALVGAAAGIYLYGDAVDEGAEKQLAQNAALEKTINSFLSAADATASAKKRLEEISALPLTQEQTTERRLSAEQGVSGIQLEAFVQAEKTLRDLAGAIGKTSSELAALSSDELKKLADSAELTGNQFETLKVAQASYNSNLKNLSDSVASTRQTLQGAAEIDLRDVDFSQLEQNLRDGTEPATKFGQALKANEEALRAEATAKAKQLRDAGDFEGGSKILSDTEKFIGEQRTAYKQQQTAIIENEARIKTETQARIAILQTIKQQNKVLNDINNATKDFQNQAAATAAEMANLNGQVAKIDIKDVDLGENLPIDQLESNLDQFLVTISSLSPELQSAGQEAAEALLNSRKLIDAGFSGAVSLGEDDLKPGVTGDELVKLIGLDDASLQQALGGSEDALITFKNEIQKAAENGIITPEEAKKLFAPVEEANQGFANQVKALTDTTRAQADSLRANIALEQAQREKSIEGIQKYNDVVSKGAEVLAAARGTSSAAARGRAEREARQRTLDAGTQSRGGLRLQAGNVAQLSSAKRLAEANLKVIRTQIEQARANGANAITIAKLEKQQQQLINTTKDASEALLEIANSSAKIDELNEALDKERQIREQAFAVLKEFVAGGASTRESLQSGASGILQALRTGTTQNQSEEQRSATFALLDKLKDVQIGSTGLTGGQVANEIVFRDAVRLGFPPDIAKQLATQTTTEQQILQELKRQTALQQNVGAIAFNQGGPVQYRAGGGTIFKPRGTDTVPAMLTPGEFVIKKSSVDKIGAGNLAALNSGNAAVVKSQGGPIYRAGGGPVNYLQQGGQGGQGIAFDSALTLEGGVNALGGAAYKQYWTNAIRGYDPRQVRRYMSDAGFDANVFKALNNALNSGNFDPSRFLGKQIRRVGLILDNMNQLNKTVFTQLDGGNATIGETASFENIDKWVKAYDSNRKVYKNLTQAQSGAGKLFDLIEDDINAPDFSIYDQLRNNLGQTKAQFQAAIQASNGNLKRESTVQDWRASGIGNVTTDVTTQIQKDSAAAAGADGSFGTLRAADLYLKRGGIAYYNNGGNPADTIPAMLTPGEFVMSPEAVQKYGVGYMKSLNRGTVPGFRRGGLIGSGNVRYRANGSTGPESGGGSLSIDSSGLQGVLTDFSASFQQHIDNIITSFSGVNTAITSLANAISSGMTVTHQFSGDMKMAFNIENGDHLKNAIAEAITPKISSIVSEEISRRLDEFQAGGQ